MRLAALRLYEDGHGEIAENKPSRARCMQCGEFRTVDCALFYPPFNVIEDYCMETFVGLKLYLTSTASGGED
jgi:hypothetical protein